MDGSARGIFTKHMNEEMERTISVDVETDSTAAIGMCSRTGVGKTRHIQVRWLCIQDAIRDKVMRLKKVKGTENEADMGTKKPRRTYTRALFAETAAQANPAHTASGLDRDSKRRKRRRSAGCRRRGRRLDVSAQVTIAMLVASLTCVIRGALRQARLFDTALPMGTVERGIQSEHNPVDTIMVPTSVFCSPGGECYHKSRKCEGL